MKSALDHYVESIISDRIQMFVHCLFFILLFSFSHKMSTLSLTKVNKSKSSMGFVFFLNHTDC